MKVLKVLLALMGGILFPILIWIALGVALNQIIRSRKKVKIPMKTIKEILAAANLSIHED